MANTYTPRFGVGANQDNTSRTKTNDYFELAYAATLAVKPKSSETIYNIATLTGALTINVTVTRAVVGDKITFLFVSDGTGRVVTFGTGLQSAGTLTLTASKYGSASFIFNGTTFVEEKRAATA